MVEIDRAAVAANVQRLLEAAGGAQVWPVIKANAYSHGAVDTGRAAIAAGATQLCTATLDEARAVRSELPDVPLLVLSPLSPGEEESVVEVGGCAVTIGTPEGWARLRDRHDVDVHVKVDTGMGRWGLDAETALAVGEALVAGPRPERLAGLMSHLATADEPDRSFVDLQADRFRAIAEVFPPCPRHLSNSAAALRYPELAFDAIRPGLAVYGIDPMGVSGLDHGLQPVMRWTSTVRSVRLLQPGASTGYGRRFIADRPTRVALIPIGYADGYPSRRSGVGEVLIKGRRCAASATVSMDQFAVVLPDDLEVAAGDEVVLLGKDGGSLVSAEELARHVGTVPYEIICGVRATLERGDREVVG
ncbi:MAG: alanine racemase [Gaiellales bacterium]